MLDAAGREECPVTPTPGAHGDGEWTPRRLEPLARACHPSRAVPDVWANVAELDDATQRRLAGVLEARGADEQQQALRRTFLGTICFPRDARVLEVGCGTGVLTRRLATHAGVGSVVGVDTAEFLLEQARELARGMDTVTFEPADARSLPFDDGVFAVVVFDSTLSHVPEPEAAVAEAYRVLQPGDGQVAVFDGDYATTTVALSDNDPLQACVDAMLASSVTDTRLMRRLPAMLGRSGFEVVGFRSHGFAETGGGDYMLSIVDRGADILLARGEIGDDTAASLKAEARRRVAAGTFFGHIAYASVVGRKRGDRVERRIASSSGSGRA
jgi:ubiquinone/menaquinone biosynthesis C-methylase UbiE